ncbi:GrlR family regulatory protein [Dendrosporobacter sp. 1207_IL3150]|uniref:GrlR family regulatory protein n=1 Tax=Dendrosporobacter sp. 1207_IL3150 TaxID=3084054 RepID=UPI002FD89914
MLEKALWLVKFTSSAGGYGSGVISFANSRVFGGDSTYYYSGSYQVRDNEIIATIHVKQHSEGISIFGSYPEFDLEMTGNIQQLSSVLIGYVKQMPQMRITASISKLEDI